MCKYYFGFKNIFFNYTHSDANNNLTLRILVQILLYMAYISYKQKWESEFDNIVSKQDILEDKNIVQSKLEVHDNFKKGDKKNNKL